MTTLPDWEGTDQFDVLQTKYNNAIAILNAIGLGLDAGVAGDVPRKADGVDFNYQFVKVPILKTGQAAREKVRLSIGAWNMNSTDDIDVAHGLSAGQWKTVSVIGIIIRNDADDTYYNLERIGGAGAASTMGGWVNMIDSTIIRLTRIENGFFDGSTAFDNTSGGYNRGFIDIEYTP